MIIKRFFITAILFIAAILIVFTTVTSAVTIYYSLKMMNENYPRDINFDINMGRYAHAISQKVPDKDVKEAMAELTRQDGYNWDTLEAWMQTDPTELAMAQMTALGDTYLHMEKPGDIERFINSGYNPDAEYTIIPWLETGHVETGTMKAVTQSVTESVSALAFATIWSDPGQYCDNETIKQSIEHMQMLQIAEALAAYNIVNVYKGTLLLSDQIPGIYEQVKSIPLGSPFMTDSVDAWMDKTVSIVNDVNDGRLSESLAAKAFAANHYYYNLSQLGGKLCYTEVNATIVIHGIDLQNATVKERAEGYAANNDLGIKDPEEVIRIVLEGDEENEVYKDFMEFLIDGRYKN